MTLAAVRKLTDPERRAKESARLLARARERWVAEQTVLLGIRDGACRQLLDDGLAPARVADLIGVTRALISKRFGGGK